jgi:adenylate cyclase
MKRILAILLTVYCSLFTTNCYAQLQGQARLDSLLSELPHKFNDSDKVDLLLLISKGYCNLNADEGIKYGAQGRDIATRLGWKSGIAASNMMMGESYSNKPEFDKALECFSTAAKLYEVLGDKENVGNVAVATARVYLSISEFSKALELLAKAIRQLEVSGDKMALAGAYSYCARAYSAQNDFTNALAYYTKSHKLCEELGDTYDMINITSGIATIYARQSDYPKAMASFLKALHMQEETGNKIGAANTSGNIGIIFCQKGDATKALEYFFKGLKLNEEAQSKAGIELALSNIGQTYLELLKDSTKALDYFLQALKVNEETHNKLNGASILGNISGFYQRQKKYAQALVYCERGIKLSEETGAKDLVAIQSQEVADIYLSLAQNPAESQLARKLLPAAMHLGSNANMLSAALDNLQKSIAICKEIKLLTTMRESYRTLSDVYRLKGDATKALEASDNYHAIKDSVFSQDNREQIVKMEMNSTFDRRRLTDSLKTAEKENIAAINLQRQRSYTYMGIAGILLLVGFSFFIFKERAKSEKLLLNILPTEVARELKSKGSAEAKLINEVTVLFTDFKGFTQLSERLSPKELVSEINTCFSAFDNIMQKHGVEKIKTIGDAYMAAGGLPTPNKTHAEDVVKAALEIQAFMRHHKEEREAEGKLFFEIRIGVHTGPVVAGIVGIKKFAYDIWGDTVNTASRMESSGSVSKVNISETTYELVKDKFSCEYRGEVEVKGKGAMRMYFVG